MKILATLLILAVTVAPPQRAAAESVDWQVTVTAVETCSVGEWVTTEKVASISGSGGVTGYVPPANTTMLNIMPVVLSAPAGCSSYGEMFYNVPLNAPYYSVWYTYLGPYAVPGHRVDIFAGNPGGTPILRREFNAYCPNGYREMRATFDAMVSKERKFIRIAADMGTLSGSIGETASAAWAAEPQAQAGCPLGGYTAAVSGGSEGVSLAIEVDSAGTSGTVFATFEAPACVPSAEVCDGVDNDCDGAVDEDLGTLSCGTGACAASVAACVGGKPQTCVPGAPSAESCDGVDNNCDGAVDEGLGTVSCGSGACANTAPFCSDGQTLTCEPLPASAETCDGVDNDCDGVVDNGCSTGVLKVLERILDGGKAPPGFLKNLDKKAK